MVLIHQNQKQQQKLKKQQFNKFIKLSGLGIQMGVVIYLSAWVGGELDIYFNTNTNTYKVISILVGFLLSLLSLITQLNKINKEDEN